MSSRGAVFYETAKGTSQNPKPLVGRSPYHVHNTRDFVQHIRCIQLQPDECIMSYDVKALFASVPIGHAINIIKKHLEEDKELQQRTSMTVSNIICLLEFCMKNTYFLFQSRYYEQLLGAAMGSPISPMVANLYMEDFEIKALSTSPHPTPFMWKRYVDDTFAVIKSACKRSFLEHINSIDQYIQFTGEDSRTDGSMPFLDILVIPQHDGSLNKTVYRKIRAVCSSPQLLQKEEEYFSQSSGKMQVPSMIRVPVQNNNKRGTNNYGIHATNNQKPYMVVPYTKGLS